MRSQQYLPTRSEMEWKVRCAHMRHLFSPLPRGVLCAVRKVGYFGACGRTRNPYFVILGALLLFETGYFDGSLFGALGR